MALKNDKQAAAPTTESTDAAPTPPVASSTPLTLTLEQLQALIASAVQAAKSDQPDLGTQIGEAVARGMAAVAPRRKVSFGEYDPKTFVQPDKRKTLTLRRNSYQNGTHMLPHVLSNVEIDLLNRITHSGRYINRMIEVIVRHNGSEEEVYLRYGNKTRDQMLNNSRQWTSLTHMLQQIVDAQEVENREREEMEAAMKELRKRGQQIVAEKSA